MDGAMFKLAASVRCMWCKCAPAGVAARTQRLQLNHLASFSQNDRITLSPPLSNAMACFIISFNCNTSGGVM